MIRNRLMLLTALAVLSLLWPSLAVACPTCKEGLAATDPVYAGMVRGYFWSIVFMMSMPFLILSSLSSYFYYQIVRARRLAATSPTPTP